MEYAEFLCNLTNIFQDCCKNDVAYGMHKTEELIELYDELKSINCV